MEIMTGRAAAAPGRRPIWRRYLAENGPGVLLCMAIVLPAWELSRLYPSLDALTLSLLMGMVLRHALGPVTTVQPGVKLVSAVFIPLGIMFYGTRLDFGAFASLPVYVVLLVVIWVAAVYLVMLTGARLLGIGRGTGLLIASGTAICGATAIAVLSPVVGARWRETSMALIVTTTTGLIGALLYPLVADSLSMPAAAYGVFCGATLQQIGIVKLAASHLGHSALVDAFQVKMLRIAMLAPMTVLLGVMASLKAASLTPALALAADGKAPADVNSSGAGSLSGAGAGGISSKHGTGNGGTSRQSRTGGRRWALGDAWSLAWRRAWFIPFFIALAIGSSILEPPAGLRRSLDSTATVFLSLALASIGLTVDFDSIRSGGSRPLILSFAGWVLVGCMVLVMIYAGLSWAGAL